MMQSTTDSSRNFFDEILPEVREGDDQQKSKLIDLAFNHYKVNKGNTKRASKENGAKEEPEGLDFAQFSKLLEDLFSRPGVKGALLHPSSLDH